MAVHVMEPSHETRVFRAGAHMRAVSGIFAGLAFLATVTGAVVNGDWQPVLVVVVAASVLFALQLVLRLAIGPDGIGYRNLTGARSIPYAAIARARVNVLRPTKAPQGVAAFQLELHNGRRVRINLRTFSVEAAATLFSALEARGIEIKGSPEWAARRLMEQVRAAQAKATE